MADFDIPKNTIVQYLRNKKRVPYGVLVAVKSEHGFAYGYSLCNKKDRFNKRMALEIAIGRAKFASSENADAPRDILKSIPAFFDRCKRYYKV